MEQRTPTPMTPFDELTTPPQFRMLKLMLPCTPDSMRPMLAVFIKFMELQYTMRLVSENPSVFSSGKSALSSEKGMFSSANAEHSFFPSDWIDEILPYLSPRESEMLESMRNMMNMMEMMQGMQEMSTEQNSSASSGLNPMDFLQNMLSPDQQELFQNYQNILDEGDSAPKSNA